MEITRRGGKTGLGSWHAVVVAMAVGAHVGPWTEEDLIGLPDEGQRYELLEGALFVNPPPGGLHQRVALKLASRLDMIVPSGLTVVEAMGIRLVDGSLFIPDILVVQRPAMLANHSGVFDPDVVRLVVEVVSPGSRTQDRLIKPALYGRSGIPYFWRVELEDGPALHACRLEGGAYVDEASARPGERLDLDEPFPFSLDPEDLSP